MISRQAVLGIGPFRVPAGASRRKIAFTVTISRTLTVPQNALRLMPIVSQLIEERNHAMEIANHDTIVGCGFVRIEEHSFDVRKFRAVHIPVWIVANEDRLLRRNAESRKCQAEWSGMRLAPPASTQNTATSTRCSSS